LEKENLSAQPKKFKRCFRQSLRSVFHTKIDQIILHSDEKNRREVGFKIHDKVEQISTARFKKFRMAIAEV